jgi:acyl-CoA thioester hydrolase
MERVKVNLPATYPFSTQIAIRITDLNYGGHVGNDVFLSLIHEARQQFLLYYGCSELNFDGYGLILADAALEYKKELSYGDIVKISVAANGFDKYGFDLFYKLEVSKADNIALACKAKTAMLCYDYNNKKLMPISEKTIGLFTSGV